MAADRHDRRRPRGDRQDGDPPRRQDGQVGAVLVGEDGPRGRGASIATSRPGLDPGAAQQRSHLDQDEDEDAEDAGDDGQAAAGTVQRAALTSNCPELPADAPRRRGWRTAGSALWVDFDFGVFG